MEISSSPDTLRFYVFVQCEPGKIYEVGLDITKQHLPSSRRSVPSVAIGMFC